MYRKIAGGLLLGLVLAGAQACNILQTSDDENVLGLAVHANPYRPDTGAARLSLQMYQGCAITANGRFAGVGTATIIPNYPTCQYSPNQGLAQMLPDPSVPPPTDPIHVMTGQLYFLNQLSIINTAFNQFTDPNNLTPVADWFENLAPFNKLDWSNVGVTRDEVIPSQLSLSPYAWDREVFWDNANWMKRKDDTFTVDVLDQDGNIRATQTYARIDDFLIQNPANWHTFMMWRVTSMARPAFPGDTTVAPAPPPPPGFPPTGPVTYQAIFKIEVMTSTHPDKQFLIPDQLSGDGAIRVTWSQLPDDPFYWPVHFDHRTDLPTSCYSGADHTTPVPCDFGVTPDVTMSRPQNGTYYMPGETVQVNLAIKDVKGDYIHPKDHFPSWNDYITDNANGLLYFNFVNLFGLYDQDIITGFQVGGPKQDIRPQYRLNSRAYFRLQTDQMITGVGDEGPLQLAGGPLAALNVIPGLRDADAPTTWTFTLPPDAKSGTYSVYWLIHRYWEGERITKMKAFDFQVGTDTPTKFPGRVGNCQICHRGSISLDNVRHGVPVDYVEGCITCHSRDEFGGGRDTVFWRKIHRFHMSSFKFPKHKNECIMCHLTKESALRPSYSVCGACHFQPHGTVFANMDLITDFDPTIKDDQFADCGSSCHANTPPTQHILPEE